MNTKPCKQCGKAIWFAITPKGRTVALDPIPAGRYLLPQDTVRRDPSEPRVEYWRTYRAHAESCGVAG